MNEPVVDGPEVEETEVVPLKVVGSNVPRSKVFGSVEPEVVGPLVVAKAAGFVPGVVKYKIKIKKNI